MELSDETSLHSKVIASQNQNVLWKHKMLSQISKRTATGFLLSWAWNPASLPGVLVETPGISGFLSQSWASGYLNILVPTLWSQALFVLEGLETVTEMTFSKQILDYINTNHARIFLSMENFQGDSIFKLSWKGFSFSPESSAEYDFWLFTRPCKIYFQSISGKLRVPSCQNGCDTLRGGFWGWKPVLLPVLKV